ncbi:MAG: ATP-binding protein [Desulfobacteraceae bacterium]|nr:ATP-binding protein [Desulfobacteraceae bacterium]
MRLKGPKEKIEYTIDFVNRLNEMQFITNIYSPPYILISSPMGYGKTRLVHEIANQLEKQNWLCIHTELWRQKRYTIKELTFSILQQIDEEHENDSDFSSTEEYGEEVGKAILKKINRTQQKNIIILIDEIEGVREDDTEKFLNNFIPTVIEVLKTSGDSIQFRLILSGRHIFHWKSLSFDRIILEPTVLNLFDFLSAYQMVEHFSTKSNLDSSFTYKQQFAAHLMYFTGGHPGCIAKILSRDLGTLSKRLVSNEEKYFETIVKPVIEEIKEHIPDDLEKIFDTLSVIRRFSPQFLRVFIDKGLIEWPGSEYDLEDRLLKTYLVRKENGFLKNDITRHLLCIHLRKNDLSRFIEICDGTVAFYNSKLEDFKCHRPENIAVELLFQKMQYFYYKKQSDKEQFIESIPQILDKLALGRDSRSVMESFTELLNRDWEFRFTFNYLLGEEIYDEYPFKELMENISGFIHELQEEECS